MDISPIVSLISDGATAVIGIGISFLAFAAAMSLYRKLRCSLDEPSDSRHWNF